ncbi:MAG TPA: hypothetical protein VFK80_08170 [Limnochordia bacterium]|nr:hypothetical protein [Limnochordia bacterium]
MSDSTQANSPTTDSRKAQFEAIIAMIPDVKAVRVVCTDDADAEIEEIHVLARPDRSAKAIARDIESSLAARFGLQVEHRKISVAQLEPEEDDVPRVVLAGYQTRAVGHETGVTVELRLGERRASGTAAGPAYQRSRLASAAKATLAALSELVQQGVSVFLEDIDTIALDNQTTVVCAVCLSVGERQESLPGGALLKRDDIDAAIRASLAAINRRIEPYLLR